MVRKPGIKQKIFHADLWGKRQDKYRACLEREFENISWDELQPKGPFYLFIPQDESLREDYDKGWKITEIFLINSVGIVTARDDLTIQFTRNDVRKVIDDFSSLAAKEARRKYNLGQNARDWKVHLAQEDLKNSGLKDTKIVPLTYHPFDNRYSYYTGESRGFHCMPRGEVMRHMLYKDGNIGLMTTRLTKDDWSILATEHTIGHKAVSRYDIGYLFPLYLYNTIGDKEPNKNRNNHLFVKEFQVQYNERRENFAQPSAPSST